MYCLVDVFSIAKGLAGILCYSCGKSRYVWRGGMPFPKRV